MALQIKRTNSPNTSFDDAGLVPGQLAYNYVSGELAIGPYTTGNTPDIIGGKKYVEAINDLSKNAALKSDFGEGSIVRNLKVTDVKKDEIEIKSEIFNVNGDPTGTAWPLYLKVSGLEVSADYLGKTKDVSGLLITNKDRAVVNPRPSSDDPLTKNKRVLMQSITFDGFSNADPTVTGWMVDLDNGKLIGMPINLSGIVNTVLSPVREDIATVAQGEVELNSRVTTLENYSGLETIIINDDEYSKGVAFNSVDITEAFTTTNVVHSGQETADYPIISGLGNDPSQKEINKSFDSAIRALDQEITDRGIVYSVNDPATKVWTLKSLIGNPTSAGTLEINDILFVDLDPSEQSYQEMKAWCVYKGSGEFDIFVGAFNKEPKEKVTFKTNKGVEVTGLIATFADDLKPPTLTGADPILKPKLGDVAIVLKDEFNNNQTWKWRYFDRNGDGVANWVPVALADADTVYSFSSPWLTLDTGNLVSFNKGDLVDASDSKHHYISGSVTFENSVIFNTGLTNAERPYFSGYENFYISTNAYNGFNGQYGRYIVNDAILAQYALRKITLYGNEVSSGLFSLGGTAGQGRVQNITGVVTAIAGGALEDSETLNISGYIDESGKFIINKFDLDDGEW